MKCKRCSTEMIEVKHKIKPVLLNTLIYIIMLLTACIISMEINLDSIFAFIIGMLLGLKILLNLLALVLDGVIRYECQKCSYSKQKVSLVRTILGIF